MQVPQDGQVAFQDGDDVLQPYRVGAGEGAVFGAPLDSGCTPDTYGCGTTSPDTLTSCTTTALEAGWPIATGSVEGACRHLIGDRLDITGARWGLAGAEAVLKLRAVHANDDLDPYLAYHHTREHQRTYPDQHNYQLGA